MHLAAITEMLHTATLVHDDVIDESGQRRGKPTANATWDNATAVLVGDYLIARAFNLLVGFQSLPLLQIFSDGTWISLKAKYYSSSISTTLPRQKRTTCALLTVKPRGCL